jgi:hypothetical protein
MRIEANWTINKNKEKEKNKRPERTTTKTHSIKNKLSDKNHSKCLPLLLLRTSSPSLKTNLLKLYLLPPSQTTGTSLLLKKALLDAMKTPSPLPEQTRRGLVILYDNTFPSLKDYREYTVNCLVMWGNISCLIPYMSIIETMCVPSRNYRSNPWPY